MCEITQHESDRVFRNVHARTTVLLALARLIPRCCSAAAKTGRRGLVSTLAVQVQALCAEVRARC